MPTRTCRELGWHKFLGSKVGALLLVLDLDLRFLVALIGQ